MQIRATFYLSQWLITPTVVCGTRISQKSVHPEFRKSQQVLANQPFFKTQANVDATTLHQASKGSPCGSARVVAEALALDKRARSDNGQPASLPIAMPPGENLITECGRYLQIRDVDRMPPFFMSVVADSDFWLFAGSNGGFTAGRVDPDHAIFPYQTVDKILLQPKASGVVSLVSCDGMLWEPWAAGCPGRGISRNLYKHVAGTSVIYEEIHQELGLAMRWELTASERFGLVRRCHLENLRDKQRDVRILDGWTHLLPAGVTQEIYARYSYLAAAYMRHESVPDCGLGIYTLNSGITDRAEPCESLWVSCAWSLGLENPVLLLCDRQVAAYRRGAEPVAETEIRGMFGAHLLSAGMVLAPRGSHHWHVVADTGLDHTAVGRLRDQLADPEAFAAELAADLADGVVALERRIAGAGAFQQSADRRTSVHHFANVLFNCMRGGTLHDNYRFPSSDFRAFLKSRNVDLMARHEASLAEMPDLCTLDQLNKLAAASGDPQFVRLAGEYMPLCFSRRHGDPSRPWNRFEIHTKDTDGLPLFAYAGNWRDIFQNWESLAYSYPLCFEAMISIFLNASTADGYNPYRITREGIDWEVFDAADPWSHIGYWGDHQIIYLLRLLEGQEHFRPGRIRDRLNHRCHAYANVPYEICGLDEQLADPKHSIRFNDDLHGELLERSGRIGGDGKLVIDGDGGVLLVTLAEKLLVPLLVKLSNLVPGGGIWLNTQRPEWNDANNALAGWGLSVVTVCHLRRYIVFLESLVGADAPDHFDLTRPVADFLDELVEILPAAAASIDNGKTRFELIQSLGHAGERHRRAVYQNALRPFTTVATDQVRELLRRALAAVDATLSANIREDHLFHSYNLLELSGGGADVHHLELMLEGQVAAMSSGALTPADALRLMTSLRGSGLYREDQNSYLLYPDREITPFLQRNTLPDDWQTRMPRLAGKRRLVRIGDDGRAHFNPDLTNVRDLHAALDTLAADPEMRDAVESERALVAGLWEDVFKHRSFTGRSGAMFAFEGLGSIYWHMVAKLLLAVQEIHQQACSDAPDSPETAQLSVVYDQVRAGLGFTKSAEIYGAFPSDPYSHSPRHSGAQQPGMTGQVKEEILTRMGELGVRILDGEIHFEPALLKENEFFSAPHVFNYFDTDGSLGTWELGADTLAFTLCQVPVCYELADAASITVEMRDGTRVEYPQSFLAADLSLRLFGRENVIRRLRVKIPRSRYFPR